MAKKPTRPGPTPKQTRTSLPTREEVLQFLEGQPGKIGKREIARAFNIKANDKVALKALLKDMAEDGQLVRARKRIRQAGRLPETAVIAVLGQDRDGELYGEPVDWDRDEEGPPPRVLIQANRKDRGADFVPAIGDRLLARISALDDGGSYRHSGKPLKKLSHMARRLLGVFRAGDRGGGIIMPIDRRQLREWRVERGDEGDARDGELVRFDIARQGRTNLPSAQVAERLGNPTDQRQVSLIAVHAHGIPDVFPERVEEEVENLPRLDRGGRTDLRDVPLITIDPIDARDHDDAVWAAPDEDPRNAGGFVAIVAIADVAAYVRPGSALDREASRRGNSVYFPDRVVPMLPERISNDLCSLREGEERPCLTVRMVFDKHGHKRSHTFSRALMRSAAKLAYEEAQAAIDGRPGEKAGPLVEPVLKPLWAAYRLLAKARDERGPLELEIPERRIMVGKDGRVARVVVPERLEAHRLIEELMIQANVAAAETLEQKRTALLYRVHAEPSKEKLASLRDFLETLDVALPKAETLKPTHFNRVLRETRGREVADLVNEVVLRSQSQAEYAPANEGHFGLNLARYAHFTSPIRRYADLVVHRALVRALGLGEGGLEDFEVERLAETATTISQTERRAMAAERETADRLIAAHLAEHVGAEFPARISGVTRHGLFVRLADTGADGFVPVATLGSEYYNYDETVHALVADRSGETYQLGQTVQVRLVEAVPTAGALRFEMLSAGVKGSAVARRGKSRGPTGKRGRPAGRGRR